MIWGFQDRQVKARQSNSSSILAPTMDLTSRPIDYFGHHIEFNQLVTDQSSEALHTFRSIAADREFRIIPKTDVSIRVFRYGYSRHF